MKSRILLFVMACLCSSIWAQDPGSGPLTPPGLPPTPILPAADPIAAPSSADQTGIQWEPLLTESFAFLMIEHAYRYANEQGTRDPDLSFFRGYINSVANLHGWADGDPFYVNYVGHPMQGAVSGFLWIQNDRRFRGVEFGRNSAYWKSRLRAGAFAWAYSEQMEIGLISEASIGNIQATFPQQGFVDHVVTPAIGLGWLVTEDAMDRYVIRFIEARTRNRLLKVLVRGGPNPSRSFANVISGQWPWAHTRDSGADALWLSAASAPVAHTRLAHEVQPRNGVAPFELASNAYVLGASSGPCVGGWRHGRLSNFTGVAGGSGCERLRNYRP